MGVLERCSTPFLQILDYMSDLARTNAPAYLTTVSVTENKSLKKLTTGANAIKLSYLCPGS
jgi:hypothetical protein